MPAGAIMKIGSYLKLPYVFLSVAILALFLSRHSALGDFGNYYYGSRLLMDGKFDQRVYTDIHYFNQQIATYGEARYFENYIPVPPLSALLYMPFCCVSSGTAKLAFNFLGVLALFFSLRRLQQAFPVSSPWSALLPLVFFFPLYNNLVQGQTYLLLTAAFIHIFLLDTRGRWFMPGLLLALAISLKLFPLFLLLYFFIRGSYRALACTVVFLGIGYGLVAWALPQGLAQYYFTAVVPRLANNDVVGPFYFGNQSLYTLLLHLFCYDGLGNPQPLLFDAPPLVAVFDCLLTALMFSLPFAVKKHGAAAVFVWTLLAGTTTNRYSTSYGLIALLPALYLLLAAVPGTRERVVVLVLTLLSVSWPTSIIGALPGALKFVRFILLLGVFAAGVLALGLRVRFYTLAPLFFLLLATRYLKFPIQPANYLWRQNSKGIAVNAIVNGGLLELRSTLGERDTVERFDPGKKVIHSEELYLKGTTLYFRGSVICDSPDNKKDPLLFGDSLALFLSDLNQGIRFYKLRTVSLYP